MTPEALSSSPRAELRAIKWFTLTHAAGLLLFALIMGGFFWYLHVIEAEQQRQTLYRDVEWAQQSLRLRLRQNQDEISASTSDWALSDQIEDSRGRARDFLVRNPDAVYLARMDAERRVVWLLPTAGVSTVMNRTPGQRIVDSAGYTVFHEAREERRPTFSAPFVGADTELLVELHAPVIRNGAFLGTIVVGYSLNRILSNILAPESRDRYQVTINDEGGNLLVSSSPRTIHESNFGYELPLDPPGHGIRLKAHAFDTQPRLVERSLLLAVVGLSGASLVSLGLLWRHSRRRIEAEAERDRVFRLSQDLICVLDIQGRTQRVNPAFEAMFGRDGALRSLTELAHPDDRSLVESALAQAGARAIGTGSIEARFACGSGWRWLHWSLRGDPELLTATLYGIAHDITERKQAESALAAETAFRRAMDDSMLTGMRAFDLTGRITYVNRAFCEMLGFDREELIGAVAPFPYWPDDDLTRLTASLQAILRGESPPSGFETRMRRKDGSTFDSRMYISPLVDSEGRQTGWMTSITDITEPKRVREELAAAHERFTTVLDELEAAIWVLPDRDDGDTAPLVGHEPLFANRMFRHMFGASADLGRLLEAGGAAAGWVPREVFHPGLGRWFELRTRRIRWVDGSSVRLLVATDVTRRHEAEERHREQDEKLQRTSRLVTMGEMASSLAHELNQPLTAIANYCMGLSARVRSKLAQGQTPDAQEMLEMLRKTAAQAERAGKVIRRIREFVKRSEPERRPCEVSAIVADAVGLAEIDAQRLGVSIDVRTDPDIPTLSADPILIEQVLLNLMKNGIEAMRDAAHRRLALDITRRDGMIEFAVTDAGKGLAPDAREKLFEPFFTTKAEGMGIGLNICRSIVESHQGRLWVEDNAGDGCTFRFTLPAPERAAVARAA
jgi:PAS domain S-box-containing protein